MCRANIYHQPEYFIEKKIHTSLDSQQEIFGTPYDLYSVFSSLAASILKSIKIQFYQVDSFIRHWLCVVSTQLS